MRPDCGRDRPHDRGRDVGELITGAGRTGATVLPADRPHPYVDGSGRVGRSNDSERSGGLHRDLTARLKPERDFGDVRETRTMDRHQSPAGDSAQLRADRLHLRPVGVRRGGISRGYRQDREYDSAHHRRTTATETEHDTALPRSLSRADDHTAAGRTPEFVRPRAAAPRLSGLGDRATGRNAVHAGDELAVPPASRARSTSAGRANTGTRSRGMTRGTGPAGDDFAAPFPPKIRLAMQP